MISQAEFSNPNLSFILLFSLIELTKLFLKLLILNKYLGMTIMKTLFMGSLFSACDVTAWAREVMHWTSTDILFLAKGPYPLGDFGVIGGTIGRRRPIVPPITLWVWPIYRATGRLIAGRSPSPGDGRPLTYIKHI